MINSFSIPSFNQNHPLTICFSSIILFTVFLNDLSAGVATTASLFIVFSASIPIFKSGCKVLTRRCSYILIKL